MLRWRPDIRIGWLPRFPVMIFLTFVDGEMVGFGYINAKSLFWSVIKAEELAPRSQAAPTEVNGEDKLADMLRVDDVRLDLVPGLYR